MIDLPDSLSLRTASCYQRNQQGTNFIWRLLQINPLSNRSKGHGSGIQRSPLSGMLRFLNVCVVEYSPLPLQWQYTTVTTPAPINSGTVTKTVPAYKIKGQCAGNTPTMANTLIFADMPILQITTHLGWRLTLLMLASNKYHRLGGWLINIFYLVLNSVSL